MSARRHAVALAALLLALGLAGCGKQGAPEAPEGLEAEYTWPRPYPSPRSVLPHATVPAPEEEGEAAAPATLSPLPQPANDALSPYPLKRSKTRTY